MVHMLVYISDLLTSVANVPARSALHASSSNDLVVPWTRWWIGYRAISIATQRAYGSACQQSWSSTNTFYHQLKTFTFESAYRHWEPDWRLFCDAPAVYKVGGILQTTVTVTALPLGTEKPQIRVSKTLPCDCGCRDGWTQSTWKPRSHSEHRSKSVYTHIHTLLSPIWFLHWNFYLQMPITN